MNSCQVLFLCCIAVAIGTNPCCRTGWKYFNGSCYVYSNFATTWAEAAAFCLSTGAKLAEIETSEENEFLKRLAREKNARTWLGGSDVLHEGRWIWMHSQRAITSFTDWGSGEPNNISVSGVEHCLELYNARNYTWNDVPCQLSITFFCENRAVE